MVRSDGRFRHITDLRNGNRPTAGVGLELVAEAHDDGRAALPARGIGAVAAQLVEGLNVRTHAIASAVGPGVVVLRDGERLSARAVVVAAAGIVDEAADGWVGLDLHLLRSARGAAPRRLARARGRRGADRDALRRHRGRARIRAGRAGRSSRLVSPEGSRTCSPSENSLAAGSALPPASGATCAPTSSLTPFRPALEGRGSSAPHASRRASTPAVTTASIPRSPGRSPQAAAQPRPCCSTWDRQVPDPGRGQAPDVVTA